MDIIFKYFKEFPKNWWLNVSTVCEIVRLCWKGGAQLLFKKQFKSRKWINGLENGGDGSNTDTLTHITQMVKIKIKSHVTLPSSSLKFAWNKSSSKTSWKFNNKYVLKEFWTHFHFLGMELSDPIIVSAATKKQYLASQIMTDCNYCNQFLLQKNG